MLDETISRRSLVKGLGLASIGAAGLALTGCSSSDSASEEVAETEAELVISSTVDTDIIVCGGGYSGMVAAVQAGELGKSVVILEKDAALGGTGQYTEGIMAVNSDLQAELGIELPKTISELVEDELVFSNYRPSHNVWTNFFTNSGANVGWLQEQGVEIGDVNAYQEGISEDALDVFHWWITAQEEVEGKTSGSALIDPLVAKAEGYGAEIYLSTPAVKLVTDETGEVTGVIGTTEEGENIQFNGKVILATGGYSANHDLIKEIYGFDPTRLDCSTPGGDGDGYLMAAETDARKSPIGFLLGGRYVYGSSGAQAQVATTIQENLLYVNEHGSRFMAEDLVLTMSPLADNAIFSQARAYTCIDQATIDRISEEGNRVSFMWFPAGTLCPDLQTEIDDLIALDCGSVFVADTLEELAEIADVEVETFLQTVETYNGYTETGIDEQYGKSADYLIPVETGPFYLIRHDRSIVRAAGSVEVDYHGRVVRAGGYPFENLLAVGVDGCMLYDTTYNFTIPASLSAWNTYSGRNAAKTACEA